ncbi:MAG: GxxExxY protein [Candidatus Marinimicrobia bacterium]|nr:GxxExxY protein [Candidatus Neomarinimicrobiota bacterium]
MDDLIYKDEVYAIIGAAIEVHREMGPGFLEAVYEECMEIESADRKLPFETQVNLSIKYKGRAIKKKYVADYIGYEKIIAEFKCIPKLTKGDEAQIINYLKATGLKVGLLINFGSKGKLEWKRYVLTQ